MDDRWVRVGHSDAESVRTAAATATGAALDGPHARLLLVFGPAGYPPEEIASAVGGVAGGVPFIGCSATGHIGSGRPPDSGVVVVGIGGDVTVETACGTDINRRPREVGVEIGQAFRQSPEHRQVVLMLTDNLAGDQQELVRGAYGELGASVPMVGGVCGNGLGNVPGWQLFNGKVLQDSVVAASLIGDLPVGVAVRHGWRRSGSGLLATASWALTRPLAISRRGEIAIRHVLLANPRDGSLICAAAVPKGAAVWIGETDAAATLTATDEACAAAVAGLRGRPAKGMLVFDCAARRALLSDGGGREWERMRDRAGDVPIAGFYGNGEIARVRGATGFHNQTIVACAVG